MEQGPSVPRATIALLRSHCRAQPTVHLYPCPTLAGEHALGVSAREYSQTLLGVGGAAPSAPGGLAGGFALGHWFWLAGWLAQMKESSPSTSWDEGDGTKQGAAPDSHAKLVHMPCVLARVRGCPQSAPKKAEGDHFKACPTLKPVQQGWLGASGGVQSNGKQVGPPVWAAQVSYQ